MSDKQKYIITCGFETNHRFIVEYLVEIGNEYSVVNGEVEKKFREIWKEKIGRGQNEFNGSVIEIKPTDVVPL